MTTSFQKQDPITAASIGLASFTSHLAENHKHGMIGIGVSPMISYILNRFDVLGSLLVGGRLGYLYVKKNGLVLPNTNTLLMGLGAFALLRISKYDKYNPSLKYVYIPTHCLWHVSIFLLINHVLQTYIY